MGVVDLKITIGPVVERDDALLGSVVLHDADYSNLEVALDYLIGNAAQELTLHVVRFEPTDEAIAGGELYQLQPSAIRDFPMVRWDRFARASIRRALGGYPINPGDAQSDSGVDFTVGGEAFQAKRYKYLELGTAVDDSDPRRRRELAEAAVARLRPDLDPSEGKGAQRSWNSLVRYAEIFDEHEDLLARGAKDPISTLAKRHEVEKPTVRSWLHRAKTAGIPQVMLELRSSADPSEANASSEDAQGGEERLSREPLSVGQRGSKSAAGMLDEMKRLQARVAELEGVLERETEKTELMAVGEALHAGRRDADMSLEQVSLETRIPVALLTRMEQGDFDFWGLHQHGVDYLRVLAKLYKISPEPLVAALRTSLKGPRHTPSDLRKGGVPYAGSAADRRRREERLRDIGERLR